MNGRVFKRWADVEPLIGDGWLALYRGTNLVSRVIQWITGGEPWSHAAMLQRLPSWEAWSDGERVLVMEMREFVGGNFEPFVEHVRRWEGRIDLFEPAEPFIPRYHQAAAAAYMRSLTSRAYGYWPAAKLAMLRVPYVRRLVGTTTDDDDDGADPGALFCSHAVAVADRRGGGVDGVPCLADRFVTPAHLAHSLLRRYVCSPVP